MSENIIFKATNKYFHDLCPKPYPAAESIPDWWRDQTPYTKNDENPDGKKIIIRNRSSNATFKKCTPMLDGLTSGYILPLWTDVYVSKESNSELPEINWKVDCGNVFELHSTTSLDMETPIGYYERAFKYVNHWHIKTPPGYSVLITSPFGYPNLPFKTLTAIIDTDRSIHEIALPIWVQEGFEGVVEKGTPMAQVIPFKRNNWKSEFNFYADDELSMLMNKEVKSTIAHNYIRNHWTKKTYK
jgi:hypothetical protein